jgi:hypothetical protein
LACRADSRTTAGTEAFAVEIGRGTLGQRAFLHRGKVFHLVVALDGIDNRKVE